MTLVAATVVMGVAPGAVPAAQAGVFAKIREFPTPSQSFESPADVALGPDGNVWFTEFQSNNVGRITPAGDITEFAVGGSPTAITVGADGNLWFLEDIQHEIGRITTAGAVTQFPVAGLFGFPQGDFEGIALGPDGNVWFTDSVVGTIGFITPAGSVTEQSLTGGPFDIVTGPDGNLWFGERDAGAIGRISPTFANRRNFRLPPEPQLSAVSRYPEGITTGPDGNIWYADGSANKVGYVTPSGKFTEFALPSSGVEPADIVTGPDGNVWFTESQGNRVAKVTPGGVIDQILLPHRSSFPEGITVGADRKIWFTETNAPPGRPGSRIATFDPAAVTQPPPPCLTVTNSVILTHDVGPCAGDGIDVEASNITVDLGGHHVFSAPGRRTGDFAGIRLSGLSHVKVKHGEVSGFDAGVVVALGSSNTLTGLNVHDNLGPSDPLSQLGDGIDLFHSADNSVVGNEVARNGPFNGISVLGTGADYNVIQGNNVHDTTDKGLGQAVPGGGTGILVDSFLEIEDPLRGQSLTGDDVIANTVTNSISSGISLVSDTSARVKNNTVVNSGFRPNGKQGNAPGNGIGIQANQVATPLTQDVVAGNTVTKAFVDGIQLPNTDGNQVRHNHISGATHGIAVGIFFGSGHSNTITENVALGDSLFDLFDNNASPPCDSNTWFDNTYSTANPICTTAGGHQVQAPATVADNSAAPVPGGQAPSAPTQAMR